MEQSRLGSLIEACINTLIGFLVSFIVWPVAATRGSRSCWGYRPETAISANLMWRRAGRYMRYANPGNWKTE